MKWIYMYNARCMCDESAGGIEVQEPTETATVDISPACLFFCYVTLFRGSGTMSAYSSMWRRLFEKWKASKYNSKTNEMSAKLAGAVGCGKKKKR